ncbi:MAG: hypothetical protein QME51_07455 [Planctomycetota bacterium]|nr:hypothetical protein [Planctomycetota bacterium]MDI6788191.1 hypothetical protein [Planctomycetota bacterium]
MPNNKSPGLEKWFLDALYKLDIIFRELKISYAIVGAIGTFIWSRPRATRDIDIVIALNKNDISKFTASASSAGFDYNQSENEHLLKSDMFRLKYRVSPDNFIPIDFILPTYSFYQELLQRRRRKKVNTFSLHFASPEDMILLKLLANRPIDKIDVEQICLFWKEKLNIPYLKKWAKKFRILERVRKFITSI